MTAWSELSGAACQCNEISGSHAGGRRRLNYRFRAGRGNRRYRGCRYDCLGSNCPLRSSLAWHAAAELGARTYALPNSIFVHSRSGSKDCSTMSNGRTCVRVSCVVIEKSLSFFHSWRSATSGSVFIAERAGRNVARADTIARSKPTIRKLTGSWGLTL
jgi:hypothetical protein